MKKIIKKIILTGLILVLIAVSVGFAALSTTLNISGTTTAKSNSWNIYFENVQIKDGSVSADTPVITNGTNLSYNVELDEPGDFYEFTVDVVNNGTIDAMIDTIIIDQLTDSQKKYIDYKVSYSDNAKIEKYNLLPVSEKETIKVYLAYKNDINAEDLPKNNSSLSLNISATYVQADDNAINKGNALYYTSLLSAIDDANNNITTNGTASAEGAKAKIYYDINDNLVVAPLEDTTIDQFTYVGSEEGYTINLNDKTINLTQGVHLKQAANTVLTLDDTGTNGNITKDVTSTSVQIIVSNSGDLTLNGGTYNLTNDGTGAAVPFYMIDSSNTIINSATINTNNIGTGVSVGIQIKGTSTATINNVTINAKAITTYAIGISCPNRQSSPSVTINNAQVYTDSANSYSHPVYNVNTMIINNGSFIADGGTINQYGDSEAASISTGNLTINNGYFKGVHSGLVTSYGNTNINGGTFESTNHGGIYFGGDVNIKNATLKLIKYDGKYSNELSNISHYGVFYIGSLDIETKVYMDNVTLVSEFGEKPAVLSSNYNIKDTYLYVSNTTFPGQIRVDGTRSDSTNPTAQGHLYVGKNVTYSGITTGSGSTTGVVDTTTYANIEFLH